MAEKLTGWTVPKITLEAKPTIPADQKITATELQELYTKFNTLVEDVDPETETSLTLPLVFTSNQRNQITLTGDLSFTLAGSGHSSEWVYREIVVDGNSVNSVTWDETTKALIGETFDNTKRNTYFLVWNGNTLVGATLQVVDLPAFTNPLVSSATVKVLIVPFIFASKSL